MTPPPLSGNDRPKKKGKKGLILGIVAAVAVLGVIVEVATSGSGSDTTEPTAAASAPQQTAPAEQTPAEEAPGDDTPGIGTAAADGQFTFTVSAVKCGVKKVGSQFLSEKAQGQFCLVTMTVENTGDETQMFDASSQKGVTNTGAEVDSNSAASLLANENQDSFLENINPGNAITDVVIVFDIAKNQTLDAVILHDSPFSGGVTVSLK